LQRLGSDVTCGTIVVHPALWEVYGNCKDDEGKVRVGDLLRACDGGALCPDVEGLYAAVAPALAKLANHTNLKGIRNSIVHRFASRDEILSELTKLAKGAGADWKAPIRCALNSINSAQQTLADLGNPLPELTGFDHIHSEVKSAIERLTA